MEFCKAARVMRTVRNMTQLALSEASGVARPLIIQIENDWTPPADVEARIRAALRWLPEMDAALDVLEREPVVAESEAEDPA